MNTRKNINLWFIDGDKKKRVPQVFSKVLLNFMLGRYPSSVFEKFSKHRLEYILEELLTKTTDKKFFSEMRPIWWPQSIEFVPISILRQKIEKDTLNWILHLQELLLSAREFYAEQLYLSRKSYKNFGLVNKLKDKPDRAKHKPKFCIKISPAIFKPIRNENNHQNIPKSKVIKEKKSSVNDVIDRKPFENVLKNEPVDTDVATDQEIIFSLQNSFDQLECLLKRTSMYLSTSADVSTFTDVSWRPFVYLDDILRNRPVEDSIDLKPFASDNCTVKVYDILKPVIVTPIEKTNYMNLLGLFVTPTTPHPKQEAVRTINYKRYSTSVPFSSIGGQMILGAFKDRYYYNSSCERISRRGCSINDPLRQKNEDTSNIEVANIFTRKKKIRSYHMYKFCRRRPLNSLELPHKIRDQYCRNMTVNIKALHSNIIKSYMKDCKVILSRIVPCNSIYLRECHINL